MPSGATTGPVAVQTPSGSAASSNAFIIRDPVSIVISPSFAFLSPGRSRQFAATVTGIANSSVIWSVEGLLGGSSITGTITDGLYTAPSSIYQPAVVTITARSVVDPAIKADVPVYLNVERIVSNSVSVIVQPQPQLVVQGPFVSPDVSVVVQPQSQLVTQGPFVSPDVSVVVQPQPQLISQGPFIAPNISLAIGPYIDSISPTSGVQGGNYQMTITGIGFSGVSAVDFYLNGTIDTGIAVSNFQVNTDGTQITADVNISPAATANIRLVKITALYGTSQGYYSNGNIFTVTTP